MGSRTPIVRVRQWRDCAGHNVGRREMRLKSKILLVLVDVQQCQDAGMFPLGGVAWSTCRYRSKIKVKKSTQISRALGRNDDVEKKEARENFSHRQCMPKATQLEPQMPNAGRRTPGFRSKLVGRHFPPSSSGACRLAWRTTTWAVDSTSSGGCRVPPSPRPPPFNRQTR